MKTLITKTQKQAINLAKKNLAFDCGKSFLKSNDILISFKSTRCTCGETGAVEAYSLTYQKCSVVGYCSDCYNN